MGLDQPSSNNGKIDKLEGVKRLGTLVGTSLKKLLAYFGIELRSLLADGGEESCDNSATNEVVDYFKSRWDVAPDTKAKPTEARDENERARVHIRWMIRRDMPEVLQAEQMSFEYAWNEEDFLHCLRQRNCIGMVAEHGEKIVGFMIYELHKNKLHILNFAVHPAWRRLGVAAQMTAKLISKLSSHRRTRITLELRETNLHAQLFFHKQEFKAVRVLRSFYEDSGEDAFLMEYRFGDEIDGREEAAATAVQGALERTRMLEEESCIRRSASKPLPVLAQTLEEKPVIKIEEALKKTANDVKPANSPMQRLKEILVIDPHFDATENGK